jgi:hypothetical protein
MKLIDLKFDKLLIIDALDNDIYQLFFMTGQNEQRQLLDSLGFDIKIDFKEEYNGNIILYFNLLDKDNLFPYDTKTTIKDSPNFIHLKNKDISFWTVAYKEIDVIRYDQPFHSLSY